MSSFDKIKHPSKKLLDDAEAKCLFILSRLLESGLVIGNTHNDLESVYLYALSAPEDALFGLEIHYEVGRQYSGMVLELIFLDEDKGLDRASLFRLCWWNAKGWFIELDTVAEELQPSEQALAFAKGYNLSNKGQAHSIEEREIDTILRDIVEQFKSGF